MWHDDLYMTFGSHGTRFQQRPLIRYTATEYEIQVDYNICDKLYY